MLDFASYLLTSVLSLLPAHPSPVSSLVSISGAIQISSKANLTCGSTTHPIISGYFSVPESTGNLFFSLFPSERPGLVINYEGGPGASGFDFPFIGAGPCQLGDEGRLEPAEHSWTNEASLLVLDYPVGAGWSFASDPGDVPNSAMWAAEEFDDFLQSFLVTFPEYIHQGLLLHSISYGGTYMPHIASTILHRNRSPHASRNRINKHVDQILLGNPCGDAISDIRWRYNTTCIDQPPVFEGDLCSTMRDTLPECLEALDYAYLNSTVDSRMTARRLCFQEDVVRFEKAVRDRFDRRNARCFPPNTCMDWYDPLDKLMNSEDMRTILGVPSEIKWRYMNAGGATARFIANADNMQGAYRLLTPVLEAGTRVFVYNGAQDTMCPWRANLAWMERLSSPYLTSFRSTPFRNVTVGRIKGDERQYSLLLIDDGGHVAIMRQPALLQKLIGQGVRGE